MSDRLDVRKTYKLLVNGAFPRSESGRSYEVTSASGEFLANVAQGSRKDLRDAVVAARTAQSKWWGQRWPSRDATNSPNTSLSPKD